MAPRAAVDERHAEVRGEHARRGADLRAVAHKDKLAVLERFARWQMLEQRAQVAQLLRRVVVVGHAVDDRHRAAFSELDDGFVRRDGGHHDVREI